MSIINGLNEADTKYFYNVMCKGKSVEEIDRMVLEIKQKYGENLDEYQIFDKLWPNRGTEAYNRLSQFRLQSSEYYTAFSILDKTKSIDINTKEGLKMHCFRNKNQYGKAPKDLPTMKKFVEKGYFICEGYSPCHNIPVNQDNEDYRYKTLSYMVHCVRKGLLGSPNLYAKEGNISFRGKPGTSFAGCQFVYNDKTNKLVTDKVNRGTWDFGKYGTLAHVVYDINPWITIGNAIKKDKPEEEKDFIMPIEEESKYLNTPNTIVSEIKNADSAIKTAWDNINNFVKTNFKQHKTVESLSRMYSGEEYLEEEQAKIDENKLKYVQDFLSANFDRLKPYYENDVNNINKFVDLLRNVKVQDSFKNFDNVIESFDVEVPKCPSSSLYLFYMKEVLTSDNPMLKEGDTINLNSQHSLLIHFTQEFSNTYKNHESSDRVAPLVHDMFNSMSNRLTDDINNFIKANNLNISIRILTPDINSKYDFVSASVDIEHKISKMEEIVFNKKNFTKNIENPEDFKHTTFPEETDENINIFKKPEYLETN